MEKQRITILDKQRIDLKLRRMAYQLWEHNSREKELTIIGIEHGGMAVANNLADILKTISPLKLHVLSLKLNKKEPLKSLPGFKENLNNRAVVLVDDVANSGKTLLYALRPLLDYMPSRVLIAVLVDRKHKSFPITPDIVGHTVSTTLQEQIIVAHEGDMIQSAYLQ